MERGATGGQGYGSQGWGQGQQGRWSGQSYGYGQPEGGRSFEQGYGRERGRSWSGEHEGGTGQSWGQSRGSYGGGYGSSQAGSEYSRHIGRGPKGYARSDDRIKEDVCDRLTDDASIDASEIEVKVSGAEVTLAGTVDSREAKHRAENCAEAISGVKNVLNNLRVQDKASSMSESSASGSYGSTSSGKSSKTGSSST